MFVRVRKKNAGYYRSIVYATLGIGWFLQYIVLNPNTNEFDIISYLDKTAKPAEPLVEMIQPDNSEFVTRSGAHLLKLKRCCKDKGIELDNVDTMSGYCDVCDNVEFLSDLLMNGSVPADKYPIKRRTVSDQSDWNYILTQKNADDFMKLFAGFHDSTIEQISYTEKNGSSNVSIIFDNSGWYGIVELCFEGVQLIRIVPAPENYSREIFSASLITYNESVFWADDDLEEMDDDYSGSFVKALCLKWRKIG